MWQWALTQKWYEYSRKWLPSRCYFVASQITVTCRKCFEIFNWCLLIGLASSKSSISTTSRPSAMSHHRRLKNWQPFSNCCYKLLCFEYVKHYFLTSCHVSNHWITLILECTRCITRFLVSHFFSGFCICVCVYDLVDMRLP